MAYTDQYEFQANLIRLSISPEFTLQYGTAADEILAILAAMRAKNARPSTPSTPPLPPPISPRSIPINVLPKNPIEEAAARAKEALDRARDSIRKNVQDAVTNVRQNVQAAVTNVRQTAQAAATNVKQNVQAAATNVRQTTQAAATNVKQTTQAAVTSVKTAAKNLGKKVFSDRRLKTDIVYIGQSPSGINIYEFKFIADPSKKYQGVLADELLRMPSTAAAVSVDMSGYYTVDYSMIDVDFKEIMDITADL